MPATRTPKTPTIKLADIKVRDGFNAREAKDVEDLAESVKLLGVIQPIVLNDQDELIAGERRYLAAQRAGLTEIPFVRYVSANGGEAAAHAAENIARAQLSPFEEARAIQQMFDHGYSTDGAAKALGMSPSRVTRRLALLKLPDEVRAIWGPDSTASLASVGPVSELLSKAPELAPLLVRAHTVSLSDDGDDFDRWRLSVDDLARNPHEYLSHLSEFVSGDYEEDGNAEWPERLVLGELGEQVTEPNLAAFGVDKEAVERYRQALKTKNELPYTVDKWRVKLEVTSEDMDAARAAGVTVRLTGADQVEHEFIIDRPWLTARIESDILPRYERDVSKLEAEAEKRTSSRMTNVDRARDVRSGNVAESELSASERREKRVRELEREAAKEWRVKGAQANADLGRALLDKLSAVKVTVEVARFFAEVSLGQRPGKSDYGRTYGEDRDAARLAMAGLRYVMPGWPVQEPKPTKANPNKTVTKYLDAAEAEKKLWAWFDAADTVEDIFGRALIIHAAAAWAIEEVLASSNRQMVGHGSPYSKRTTLPSASYQRLEKLPVLKGVLPPSVAKLIREIERFDARKLAVKEEEKANAAKTKTTAAKPKASRNRKPTQAGQADGS